MGVVEELGASDCKTEVSKRHIPTDSGINETVQQTIAVDRFAVLGFHRCLRTPSSFSGSTPNLQLRQATLLALASDW